MCRGGVRGRQACSRVSARGRYDDKGAMIDRRKDLLVLGSVLSIFLLLFLPDGKVSFGVGHVDVPLDFVFLDAATGRPVAGASLRLRDLDWINEPPREPESIVRSSGPDGHARIKLKGMMVTSCDRVTQDGRFSSQLSRSVRYPAWECRVTAEGYQDLEVSYEEFRSRVTGDRRLHEDSIPPSIVFRLRRQVRPQPVPRA
jgi:hypothetical protein